MSRDLKMLCSEYIIMKYCITIQRCTHKMDDMVYKCLTIFIPGIGHRAIRLITSNNNELTPVSPRRQFDGHYDYYFHPKQLLFHYFIQLCPQLYALSENQLSECGRRIQGMKIPRNCWTLSIIDRDLLPLRI